MRLAIDGRGSSLRGPDRSERLIRGVAPRDVAAALARRVAVWPGHSYAVEAVTALGLTDHGGGERAGVVRYVSTEDVEQLLRVLDALTARG